MTFRVVVTNTGSTAGKDVVEVYFTPPYNNGGIEKAAVNLVNFAKTDLIYGWYGPAMNTHRTAFNGRSFEYYSEDGVLAGCIASAESTPPGRRAYMLTSNISWPTTRRSTAAPPSRSI